MRPTWPPPLRPGDRVGVAALSSAIDAPSLDRGLAALRDLGYEPVPARNLASRHGILAGTDDERVDAFHELIADDSLAAVIFARGGHGLLRIIERLDWRLIARRPRAWVGYSDVTPFLLELTQRHGLVTFHGPMIGKELSDGLQAAEAASLRAALSQQGPLRYPLLWLREGNAEGTILGGCLSLLTAVLGTRWATTFDDALLFMEDVNEPLHRVDRMLTHLRLSGTLTGVRGVIAGHFGEGWEQAIRDFGRTGNGEAGGASAGSKDAWHGETLLGLPGPIAFGLASGHGTPNLTLPLGAHGYLDAARSELIVETPA
ncbi:MAG TPA: LD-carboxypeptidase [Thermoanaerobaculia bacterium]|jgi:muramoyltetrapeptide carboxypeptidase|nr:LD-carboxypeptidase [Thermoanaerobaculia bacterium]